MKKPSVTFTAACLIFFLGDVDSSSDQVKGKAFIPQDLNVDWSAPRPNVLIFLVDDMGYSDLGSYGSTNASTPNIDSLIDSGMKFRQWVSAAPICTPSRAIATALKEGGYRTGMSGKWHLGINGNKEAGQTFCFLMKNDTVVEQPLRLENFTSTITTHAVDFIRSQNKDDPWFFLMSYFHVHTPLFSQRKNRGRSRGGRFGDNVEELDDSVGEIMKELRRQGFENNTLIFFTSDNGPYQEEGWENSGRTNIYDDVTGERVGRLRGGKGQVFEGGIRMPGAVVWPGFVAEGSQSDTMVSTMDIFPTALAAAGVSLGKEYVVDGKDMGPVIRGETNKTQHDVMLHYCGFNILAARVDGRFKLFWKIQKWYTNDPRNSSICLECCNGINPASLLVAPATQLCGCAQKDLISLQTPVVYDMLLDPFESKPLTEDTWPQDAGLTLQDVIRLAQSKKERMEKEVHPKPDSQGAGTCTSGLPAAARQPCCAGCKQLVPFFGFCRYAGGLGKKCDCVDE
eukprot:jgi/Bigna1/41464/e_gw1.52.25.1